MKQNLLHMLFMSFYYVTNCNNLDYILQQKNLNQFVLEQCLKQHLLQLVTE